MPAKTSKTKKGKRKMAFLTHQYNMGDVPVMHLPAAAIIARVGTALVLSGGKLTIAKDTAKPEYISLYDGGGKSVTDGTVIPVEPVYPSTVYETELTGNLSTIAVGSVHSINASGSSITAANEYGSAKVISYDGNVAGSHVRVVFVEPKFDHSELNV